MALRAPAALGDRAASGHASGDQVVRIDVSGGVDRSRAPNEIPDGAVWFAKNAYYKREALQLQTRPGAGPFQVAATDPLTDPPGTITAGHVYTKSTSQSYLVFSCLNSNASDQELWAIDLADGMERSPVQLLDALGSTTAPTFKTMNAKLLVAVAGQSILEWGGEFDGQEPAARATGDVTVGDVNAGDWVKVGERRFTFYADAVAGRPGEVLIGASAAESAANLKTAIDEQCVEVRTTGITGAVIDLESRRSGDTPDLEIGGETALAGRLERTVFSGGVAGLAFDEIDSYGAPTPGIILGDRNGRVVAAACTTNPDRVYFSRAGNPWEWRVGPYGRGQAWDQGFQEGNRITAVAPFYDELWSHKRGQDREIYRARVADPNADTWELQWRPHEEVNAAINPRCAVTLAGKQVVVDTKGVVVYTGDDTYNEVRAHFEGVKVADLATAFSPASAFIAPNPAELYALIFPVAGQHCLCYHFASGRWSKWEFAIPISAATYCEPLGEFLVASGNTWYALDEGLATDAGKIFETEIETRALDAGAAQFVHKQLVVDYEHIIAGSATVKVVPNRSEQDAREIMAFEIQDGSWTVWDWTEAVYDSAARTLEGETLGRGLGYETAVGELLAYRLKLTGSAKINSIRARLAQEGRSYA